jgi:GTP-binding protein
MRSSTQEIIVRLQTPLKLSLEQAIDFIDKDELVEVTPENIRLRKKLLTYAQRLRNIASARRNVEKGSI